MDSENPEVAAALDASCDCTCCAQASGTLQDSQNPYSSSTELTCAPLSLQLRVGSGVKIGQRIDPAHRKNRIRSSCVVFVTAKSKLCDIPYII